MKSSRASSSKAGEARRSLNLRQRANLSDAGRKKSDIEAAKAKAKARGGSLQKEFWAWLKEASRQAWAGTF